MDNLILRRRQLMQMAASTPPTPSEWDYEWYYTDGLPSSDDGWVKNGSGTPSLQSTGVRIEQAYYTKDVAITNGVIEAKFVIDNYRTTQAANRAMLRIGDSTNCIYFVMRYYSGRKTFLWTASNINNSQNIGYAWAFSGEYVVRLTISGATAKVEINGETIINNFDTTSTYNKGTLLFGANQQYGRSTWQYVKYKAVTE